MNKNFISSISLIAIAVALSLGSAQDINISGTVTDTGGTPLSGAAVRLEKGGLPTTTGADGRFTISGIIGIIGQGNHSLPHMYIIKKENGLLYVNVLEISAVEIIAYTLQGKLISSIKKIMEVGTHSIALPHIGAGVYFYKIKVVGKEFVFKDVSIGRASGKSLSAHGSYTAISKRGWTNIPINDVIDVTKAGFLNYRVIVTNSDTSGIEIEMIVCADTVVDIDGNVYQAVQIGSQVWMVENLRTTKLNDGTTINYIIDFSEWEACTTGTAGYCYCYSNEKEKYGAIYNWHAVNTGKLAPVGWHIPTDEEWTELENYLVLNGYNWDGTTDTSVYNKIGKAMAAKTDWMLTSQQGDIGNDLSSNNRSGFSGLPGSGRIPNGTFGQHYVLGVWWSATEYDMSRSYIRCLDYSFDYLLENYRDKRNGMSIRCVKD